MSDRHPIVSEFNQIVLTGELLHGVMSDERREALRQASKSMTMDQLQDALDMMMRGVQAVQLKLEHAESALEDLEVTDKMTGLRNKNFIFAKIEEAIELARSEHDIAHTRRDQDSGGVVQERMVISLDVDGLKPINDYISPNAGDAAILAVAERLKKVVRSDDDVAHISGDEFIVLVTNRTKQQPFLENVLARYRKELEGIKFEYNGQFYPAQVSIGACLITPEHFAVNNQKLPNEAITPTAKNILDAANKDLKAVKATKGDTRHAAAPAAILPPTQPPSADPV